MQKEIIREIGIWALRIVLAVGALFCATKEKESVAGLLCATIVLSFFFSEDESD
jgi:hypothetical protein